MKADDPVTETHRRNFGWANLKEKENRGDAEEGNPKQTDHASLFGWWTRPHTSYKSPARTRIMAEQKKQERDFTPEVDVIIPETTALAQVSWVPSPVLLTF
jgi:hypothetical protein